MLYWSDEKSAKKFNDLYESALAYAAKNTGSFETYFNVNGTIGSMTTVEEMRAAVEELREPFAAVDGFKGLYLQDMLKAMDTFVAILGGEKREYTDAIKDILGFEIKEVSKARAERVENEIKELLTADGYTQERTSDKVKQWYADNRLDPDDLPTVAKQYLAIFQREMRKIVDVPEEEGWGTVELVSGKSWAAFSQYKGRYITNMLMNRDSVWKKPTFIDTVSHEMYPGHHTWYCTREKCFNEDIAPLESASMGVFSAETLLFEGIPESGAHFIGIDDPEKDIEGFDHELQHKVMVARKIQEYVRILEVNACYHCHADKWTKEQLIEYCTKDGWVEEKVAERIYTYYGHPINGYYYPAYFYGRWLITYAYDRFPAERRAEFFKMIYSEPHSTRSFIKRIEEMTGEPFDPITMALN